MAVNPDSADWMNDHGRTESTAGKAWVVGPAGHWVMGLAADPRPHIALVGEAEALLRHLGEANGPTFSEEYTGNAAVELGWDLGTLTPGETRALTVTLAVGSDTETVARGLRHEHFPPRARPDRSKDLLPIAARLEGSWVSSIYPNDIVSYEEHGGRVFWTGGCCAYSGPRGLYAGWKAAVADDGDTLSIRLPICRRSTAAVVEVVEGNKGVCQEVRLLQSREVRIRIPDWANVDAVKVTQGQAERSSFKVQGRWLPLGRLEEGTQVTIRYPLERRVTQERCGGSGAGQWFAPADRKRTFTVRWEGNRVTTIEPAGENMPPFPVRR
jgi:hypothetical protein